MIKAEHIIKHFDGFPALKGASLHVSPGSIYGLVGPNGAGKSTIIRHLAGIYKEDAGSILIAGEPVYENPSVKMRIAYIPDDIFYFPQANTLDMRNFYRGIYKNFDNTLFHKLAEYFPKIDVKRNIRSLSKGMQKQVAFWLSISCQPDILILDEPVDGLDPVMRKQIWSILMKDVADRNTTVLVSSHNLRELEDVCDHVGIMNEGVVILERSLEELQDNTIKVQVAFEGIIPNLNSIPNVLHSSQNGRVLSLIIKGNQKEVIEQIKALNPLFIDMLPLTLEEIFIYELGGENYGIKEILL
ncbi:MAG: ABC transporter ATP-binding protein [Lachnospiraceae bacterium]|nr:ABC transporter ATP-binding protein [Lachnospiraceae bacterium]